LDWIVPWISRTLNFYHRFTSSETKHRIHFRTKVAVGLGILFLLLVPSGFALFHTDSLHASAAQAGSTAIELTISSRLGVLPADGGSYGALVLEFKNQSSGVPYIPQSDVQIFLTSSNQQTGTVPDSITFPAGSLYYIADFQTTSSPGSTVITAVTADYKPTSLVVTTLLTGGMPASLVVYPSPSQILPDKKVNASAVVQVVDILGNPVKLGQDMTIALSSSDSEIGTVPSTVTIPAGSSFATVSFFPTYVAGQTIVTATAGNLSSGSATFSTIGPIPRRLVLSVAPGLLWANSGENATLSVEIQDNNTQTPAIAPSAVSVVLTSDNTNVAIVPNPIITIPAGSFSATVELRSGGTAGVATITASAQGYIKGSTVVTSEAASNAPNQVTVSFAPSTLLPNNQTYVGGIIVGLQTVNSSGTFPAYSTSPITVYARSSDNSTMQVSYGTPDISAVIPAGFTHTALNVRTTFLPGSVMITAQSPNLASDTEPLVSVGSAPNALRVEFTPNVLPADGTTYNIVVVNLIDSASGAPSKAPSDTPINLVSSNAAVGTVENSITISQGQTFGIAYFKTSGLQGTTQITASASNYTSANSTLTLVGQDATNLHLFAVPNTIVANGQQYDNLVVQLQDTAGNPAKTDTPVNVQLLAQNVTAGSVPQVVTIQPGATFANVEVNSTTSPGSINVTAFAPGFVSAQAGIKSTLLPMNLRTTLSPTSVRINTAANISVSVSSEGSPLSGVNVTWSLATGRLSNLENMTDQTGTVNATYLAGSIPGTFVLHIGAAKAGYAPEFSSMSITVYSPTPTTQKQNTGFMSLEVFSIPVWILIVVAAAGGGGGGFFFLRRKGYFGGGSSQEIEEDEE